MAENKANKPLESNDDLAINTLEQKRNVDMSTIPLENNLTSRLMNTKIVRIRPGAACACVKGCKQTIFNINTIRKRDDKEPQNENETPLFYVEENIRCCLNFFLTFNLFDPNTRELFSVSQLRGDITKHEDCCEEPYYLLPSIYTSKANNRSVESLIQRYDSRSVYRTYDFLGQSYYKIGKPYVKEKEPSCCESCLYCLSGIPCCFCFACCICNNKEEKSGSCCCCSKEVEVIDDKRTYIDIFNMTNEPVGKFALYFNKGILCQHDEFFYEIYFPPDANEMIRLALISQIIFFYKLETNYFGSLPGSRVNLEQFIN